MIANPTVPAFRYDPYSKKFTREVYDHTEMRGLRGEAVKAARKNLDDQGSGSWAVLLGTLGRQGSLAVLKSIQNSLPADSLSTFIQTSCPRLSIDWGYAFSRPLLSPYEASVAVGRVKGWGGLSLDNGKEGGKLEGEGDYPMDFYADNSLGDWTPRHNPPRPRPARVRPQAQGCAQD